MEENGIPWDHLPPSLTSLSLEDKSIRDVPSSIGRLTNLKTFNVISENLKTVAWKDMSNEIEWLRVETKNELNPMDLSRKNKITYLLISSPHLREIISFPSTTHLYLDYCRLKSFNCENSLQTLVELSIVENGMTDIAWHHLPATLENINLYKNKLSKIENIGHLINLQELRAENNDITFISSDISQLQNLKLLYLCNNHLTEFPEGFENLQRLFDLRLANNDFNYDENLPDDLNDKLWKRLPLRLGQLVLNSNNLFKISCSFRFTRLQNLHVTGCNLHHICPRIYLQAQRLKTFSKTYCLSLDIRNNENLKHLSFVPSIIYQPPLATEEKQKHDIINTFWLTVMEVASDNEKLRNTAKFPMNNYKPKYDFKVSEMVAFCECCGICGKAARTEPLKKQNMVMDFMMVFTDVVDEDPFSKPKLEPGKWKSEIHTKMCSSCQEAFIEKTEAAYKKSITGNDENEVFEKRQKLPNENVPFVLGLQPMQIRDLLYLKLKNYDAVDCFLIAAVNAIDAMDDVKNSIFKYPISDTQKELIKIFKQKIKSVRSLRETLPTFAKNEQEDAASALCKLIESIDNASQSLVMYSYDSVETCLCETQIFQHISNCIALHLTIGQNPNQSITFNSMLANWTRFKTSNCSTCHGEKIVERSIKFGNLPQYLIVELNTMISAPNGDLLPCSIPFTNFNIKSQLIFGALWELTCAIQYIGNGKTGHYITWRKNKSGWTVIDGESPKHENQLLPDLKNYRVLIFKKLAIQLLPSNDVTMEANNYVPEMEIIRNQDVYMPNQYYMQDQIQHDVSTATTIYAATPQNVLPPINTFTDHQIQYQPQQDIYPPYQLIDQYQPQYQQSMQIQHAPISNHNNISHPIIFSNQPYTNNPSHNYNTPIYQPPQQSNQPLDQPLSPISALVNASFDEHGNYAPLNNNAMLNANPPTEQEYYYYPQDDDWTWKQNL